MIEPTPPEAAVSVRRTGSMLRTALAISVFPLAALIGLQAYQAFYRMPKLVLDRTWVEHTFEVIVTAQSLAVQVAESERAQRDYFLTNDGAWQEAYRVALARMRSELAHMQRLTVDNAEQQRRLADLQVLIDEKAAQMNHALEIFEHQGLPAAREAVAANTAINLLGSITNAIQAAIEVERKLLLQRVQVVEQDERRLAYVALAGGVLTLALAVGGAMLTIVAFRQLRTLQAQRLQMQRRISEQERAAQAVFAQTQKMEALGQLTGGVAHDFNNLLHVIRNAVGLLERRLHDGTVTPLIDMIKRNVERATTTTARLLAFARQQPLEPEIVELNGLITRLDDLLRQVLGESIEIETVLGSGLWPVSVDKNQLETALINLAVNARDAMEGSGKLTIETANAHLDDHYAQLHQEVRVGQYAMIAVSDTGCGMSTDTVKRAFDPFFTTKDIGRGTGLGLSQVFGLVKQSGGHVKIYSEPGQGTTIKVYLPRLIGEVAHTQAKSIAADVAGKGESILLVEDNVDVRTFTAEVLRELGYQVSVAEDGPRALQLLEQLPGVDLLFTDVGLPHGMTGRQLAEQALKLRPTLKVLYTTAYARNSIIHHGRLDPGVDLIGKPYTHANLASKLRQVLERAAV